MFKQLKAQLPLYIVTHSREGDMLMRSYDREELEVRLEEWLADPRDREGYSIIEKMVHFPAPKLAHWHRVVDFWGLDGNEHRSLMVYCVEKLQAIAQAEREDRGQFELFEGFLGQWGAGSVTAVKCTRAGLRELDFKKYEKMWRWIDMATVPTEFQSIIMKALDKSIDVQSEIYYPVCRMIEAGRNYQQKYQELMQEVG